MKNLNNYLKLKKFICTKKLKNIEYYNIISKNIEYLIIERYISKNKKMKNNFKNCLIFKKKKFI